MLGQENLNVNVSVSMTRTERLELEELSLKAYGTRSRYKKMMEQGIRMELKDEDGRKYNGFQRFNLDEIKTLMAKEIEEKQKKAEEDARKQAESTVAGTN